MSPQKDAGELELFYAAVDAEGLTSIGTSLNSVAEVPAGDSTAEEPSTVGESDDQRVNASDPAETGDDDDSVDGVGGVELAALLMLGIMALSAFW